MKESDNVLKADIANASNSDAKRAKSFVGKIPEADYVEAVNKCIDKAKSIGAKTTVNYVPLMNVVLLKGEGRIKKIKLMSQDLSRVFDNEAIFKFVVAGVGENVKGIDLGDIVDIKSLEGIQLRPFIPHDLKIGLWREKLTSDKELMIRHNLGMAEDVSKVGSTAKNPILGKDGENIKKEEAKPKLSLDEYVDVVEYFVTEDHNISGVFTPLTND